MSETNTLRAFHGDPAIKSRYVARLRAHQLADLRELQDEIARQVVKGVGS